ncbi:MULTISPECIES: hypothetical protein [unclassified Shewanella]|uniref:hypothetical protein n=1 Tax=unclassified Shewanella TaxID=196818 RepID=UPI000C82EFF7|nr:MULTISPECIES: hypothetical protein [unclassified Shewanella]MDO6620303.1 hypothetical protein [Shewanella sp. 6_MG-2023]MDO6638590.1 hypothetical protein [Shewanella sp. 5_MG-2023]MDO6679503.1 hypothetical protein [Shewanella sp. 4_MG-2023]MDO6774590.1 hypothetical protein [Shewanella sp. 3_MG-2023]PMG32250.1 hypothetical protein BCU94_00560 [Shewanella sp. 10N.286.52.C2]
MSKKQQQAVSEVQFWIQRLGKTSLRALHIVGVVGAGGGILLGLEQPLWLNYWILAMVSGLALLSWEVIRDWRWLIQLKGVLTIFKVLLLLLFIPMANWKPEITIFIILLSVIVSHGPAGLRHYSVVHRKVIHGKKEIKG